jgi:LysR family transcriptional regulator for bpeEF and oprC
MPNAAPAYIARHGEPPTLADLTAHRAVGYPHGGMSRMKDWEFTVDGSTVTTRMNSTLLLNDTEGQLTCGLQGLGLVRAPSHVARPYLNSGRLREILPNHKAPSEPLSVVYAHGRLLSPAARACVE